MIQRKAAGLYLLALTWSYVESWEAQYTDESGIMNGENGETHEVI
jgi:hypothetical protein